MSVIVPKKDYEALVKLLRRIEEVLRELAESQSKRAPGLPK